MQQLHAIQTFTTTLLALAMMTTSRPATADTMSQIQASKRITIAYRESSLPFSYLDASGKPIGYAVDLCRKAAEAVRAALKMPMLEVVYVPVTSANRIPAIVDGKADLECGSTTNNAERRKQVSFAVAHFVATVRMLVRKESGITTWKDLGGKTVVTTKGSTPVRLLTDLSDSSRLAINIKLGQDHKDAFAILEQGKADAFVMDDVLLYGLRASAKVPANYIVVGTALSAEPYAIMMSKNDPVFKRIVDMEISRLAFSGEMEKMYNQWFTAAIAPNGINMQMPMSFMLRDMLMYPSDKVGD